MTLRTSLTIGSMVKSQGVIIAAQLTNSDSPSGASTRKRQSTVAPGRVHRLVACRWSH
jgi:hypothetical protein